MVHIRGQDPLRVLMDWHIMIHITFLGDAPLLLRFRIWESEIRFSNCGIVKVAAGIMS